MTTRNAATEMPERITFGEVRAMGETFISVVINDETKCEVIKSAEYIRADLASQPVSVPETDKANALDAVKRLDALLLTGNLTLVHCKLLLCAHRKTIRAALQQPDVSDLVKALGECRKGFSTLAMALSVHDGLPKTVDACWDMVSFVDKAISNHLSKEKTEQNAKALDWLKSHLRIADLHTHEEFKTIVRRLGGEA